MYILARETRKSHVEFCHRTQRSRKSALSFVIKLNAVTFFGIKWIFIFPPQRESEAGYQAFRLTEGWQHSGDEHKKNRPRRVSPRRVNCAISTGTISSSSKISANLRIYLNTAGTEHSRDGSFCVIGTQQGRFFLCYLAQFDKYTENKQPSPISNTKQYDTMKHHEDYR
jgi:hypothetical protein